jgi:zinc protease
LLKENEIEEEELERALNQVEAHHLFAMQSPSNRGFVLGWHEAQGDASYADRIVANLRSFERSELREVARRYFRRGQCGVARLTPVPGEGGAGSAMPTVHAAPPGEEIVLHGVGCSRRRFRSGLAKAPAVRRFRLENGWRVSLQRDATDPVVSVAALFHGGAHLDPEGKEGLSALTADTLERGTRTLEFVEFRRRFERIGSNFELHAGAELVHANATFLTRHVETGLSLIADVLEDPGFRESDLEIARSLARNDLESREDDLDDVAEDLFVAGVAGDHPYAKLPHGTRAGLDAIQVSDLRAFHAQAYRPDRAHLAIVGDFDEAGIEDLLRARFGKLANPGTTREPIHPMSSESGERVLVRTRADKAQAKMFFGGAGFSAGDGDRMAAICANHVLGGSAIRSRLGDEIRDRLGLAYSVSSRNYERSKGGFFLVHMGTRPENAGVARDAIRAELDRIADGVTPRELEDAKSYLTGSFPLRLTTYGRLSRFWARSSFYEWPEDYLATYADRVRALTHEDVRRAAARIVANVRVLAVAGPVDESLKPVNTNP